MNPARIGTSEAELRDIYKAARARLYSVPEALQIADKLGLERRDVNAANDRLAREITALQESIAEAETLRRTRGHLELQNAMIRQELAASADPGAVIQSVADKHGITVKVLLSPSRTRGLSDVRQELYYELAVQTRLSYPQIGAIVFRHHSSVYTGIHHFCKRTGTPLPRDIKP